MKHDEFTPQVRAIIERLVIARKNAGLTQKQAAKLLGVHAVSVARWETEARGIEMHLFLQLCHMYDASPAWVLTGKNPDFDPNQWQASVGKSQHPTLKRIAEILETLDYTPKLGVDEL
jgi:transcriptional regulator with XRE-family HTH domain